MHNLFQVLKGIRMNEQMDKDVKAQLILKLEAQRLLHRDEQYRNANHPEKIRIEVQAPQFMTMQKTLCFMYLGLRLTNPDVQIYDLIRLAVIGLLLDEKFDGYYYSIFKF